MLKPQDSGTRLVIHSIIQINSNISLNETAISMPTNGNKENQRVLICSLYFIDIIKIECIFVYLHNNINNIGSTL